VTKKLTRMAIFALIFMMCAITLSPAMAKNTNNPVYNNTSYNLTNSSPIWPAIFANNQSNGQSPNLGPQNNTTKWIYDLNGDYGLGGQTIGADGTIYFVSANETTSTLYALNPNGTVKWNTSLMGWYNTVAPVIGDNGLLYILTDDDVLSAFNPDGTLRWEYYFQDVDGGFASYPTVGKNGVIHIAFNIDDDDDYYGKIYTLNSDGTLKWTYNLQKGIEEYIYTYFTSVNYDGTLYVGSYLEDEEGDYGVLNAINPDGTLKWNYTFTEDLFTKGWGYGGATFGASVGPDGTIYAAITTLNKEAAASSEGGELNEGDIEPISEVHLYAFHQNGTVKWMQTIADGVHNYVTSIPSVASNGMVYLSTLFMNQKESTFGNLHAFQANGTPLWNYSYPESIYGFSTQAIGSDGTIYLASLGNPLIALNPDGTVKWTYGDSVYGIPSINKDGTLYIGMGGMEERNLSLHAIEGQKSDLYLKTLVDNKNPKVGETVKITFKVGNNGPGTAYNTTMVLEIPEGMQFIKFLAESGNATYNPSTRTITWYLGDLGVIDPYLDVWVKALAKGTYAISPVLSTLTYDPDLASNTENVTVTAQSATKSVAMQNTGVPVAAAILAILMVLGGVFGSKKRE
jgi:uncharacterized repeat protein (TIGR01451 family)